MSSSRTMKWITGGLEALLAIPFLGGTIVIGFSYTPLLVMLILHVITLVMTLKQNGKIYGCLRNHHIFSRLDTILRMDYARNNSRIFNNQCCKTRTII